jgi:hypothetical protein
MRLKNKWRDCLKRFYQNTPLKNNRHFFRGVFWQQKPTFTFPIRFLRACFGKNQHLGKVGLFFREVFWQKRSGKIDHNFFRRGFWLRYLQL